MNEMDQIKQYMRDHGYTGRFWSELNRDEKEEVVIKAAKLAMDAKTETNRKFFQQIWQDLKGDLEQRDKELRGC